MPSRRVRELRLNSCDWPEGRTLSELVEALPARGLRVLSVTDMQVGGVVPAALFEKCAEAEYVGLHDMALTGSIPASFGKCVKLETLWLYGNQLAGSIPDELGECAAMEELGLSGNELTGSVPASLGKCAKLRNLSLFDNQLEGVVPASELAKLTALETLYLVQNEGLTITASGKQEIERAAPKASFYWPRVVGA